ncbi:MAG: hypothetical protein SV186_01065 [Candidatus Nanohaloarchaea archaeon]|nr:hypothetical protein [Candidatus Nanohaloarchaea archaeon]
MAEPTALLANGSNIVFIFILILLFVVAYKLMQAVVDTLLIAVFSGGFFLALNYIDIGPALSTTNFLLFMVLGVALYMAYTTLSTAKDLADLAWSGAKALTGLAQDIIDTAQDILGSLQDRGSSSTPVSVSSSSSDDNGESGSKEKMAILEEVDDDE